MWIRQAAGVSATELAQDFATLNKTHFVDDPEKEPLELAEEFTSGEYATAEVALASQSCLSARASCVTDFGASYQRLR